MIKDNKLYFEAHIADKIKKANALAGMLRRSFTYLNVDMFKSLFTSIVRPHLEYGAPIWSPYMKKYVHAIENVQRRATKQIPGLSNLSYRDRLKLIKLPTLQYRRYRGDMIIVYKLAHGLYDPDVSNDFLDFTTSGARGYNL